MKRILLIDRDEHFLELARLGLEERLGLEIVTIPSAKEAVSILKKEISFHLVISDYQPEVLAFLISRNSSSPFFYFTDEKRIEIPVNELGTSTKSGKGKWHRKTIQQLLSRLEDNKPL